MTSIHAKLTAVSLFAGIGGFDLALERSGVDVVASVEINQAARGVLAGHFPNTEQFSDIREVTGEQLVSAGFEPARGIITGGFPCQDLSVAGSRAGIRPGTRSGLFWEIARIVAEINPRWIVLENVPGLLSHPGAMGSVVSSLRECGYGVAYRILDAQYFGVPQRRRRVFIVGHIGDAAGPVEVLFEPESGAGNSAPREKAGKSTAAADSGGTDRSGQRGVIGTLTTNPSGAGVDGRVIIDTLTAHHGRLDASSAASGQILPTLTTNGRSPRPYGLGDLQKISTGIRRLTPLECERAQGFPDDWTKLSGGKPQKDAPRYRQTGNAVAVPVAEWVIRRIVEVSER